MFDMRDTALRATVAILAVCGWSSPAAAAPILISYAAIVTSNSGTATDGVFPPGTGVRVQVQVDSESLLRGVFLPASGSAETVGVTDLSLTIDEAGSGLLIAIPGATARVIAFRGDGPEFDADGDPPANETWRWTSASLFLPLVDNLDSLLALTLDDINALIAAFGSMAVLGFTHTPGNNIFEFERASTSALYEFSIEPASVPEPSTLLLLTLAAATGAMRRRRF